MGVFRLSWFPRTICLSIVGNKGEAPKNQVRGSGEQGRKPGFRLREWTEMGMGKGAVKGGHGDNIVITPTESVSRQE